MYLSLRQVAFSVSMVIMAVSAVAQNGQLSGQVTDPQNAVVAGAEVKVVNLSTLVEITVRADANGTYVAPFLTPGRYRLTVQAEGFRPFQAEEVVVAEGQNIEINAQLQLVTAKEEVQVESGGAAHVETENAQVEGTITQQEVVSYGLNGRNFTQLIALAPGVSNQTGQDEAKVGVVGSVKYSVNGGRVEYNSFEVDGSDVLNTGLNKAASTLMVYPSLDSIQEVKVLTSNYGAMYGRTASGIVQVTTRSGESAFHGGVYEFLRNENFNARNYFDQTTSAPLYRRHDFGGTLGGPVFIPGLYNRKRDKTFFFFSEEFRLEQSPAEFNQAVPSLKERGLISTPQGVQRNLQPDSNGVMRQVFDFTDVCPVPASPDSGGFSRRQYPDCPVSAFSTSESSATGSLIPFSGNLLPGVDKNALLMLYSNLIPLPNSPIGCSYRVINPDPSDPNHCYDITVSPSTYWREELARVDHNFTNNLKLTGRYVHDSWNTTVLTPQWGIIRNSFPTVENRFVGPGISAVARLTHTISPTVLNEFSVMYTNSTITLTDKNGPGGAQFQRNPQLDQALVVDPTTPGQCNPNISLDPGTLQPQCGMGYLFNNGFGGKMPGLNFIGTNAAYGGEGFAVDPSYVPWKHTNPTYSLRDNFAKVWGKHTLQAGVEVVVSQRNQTNNAIGAASGDMQGLLTFSNLTKSTGNAFADFMVQDLSNPQLTEYIQNFTQDSSQARYYQRYNIEEPYFQDDWRVTHRLTLNLGVRVSIFGTYSEKNRNAWNWMASRFHRGAFSVDPASGVLLDATQSTPTPILLSQNNQLPSSVISNLGLVRCGVGGIPAGCMSDHLFNPAPRVGFAWDPFGDGKTSIRGGYGMFYEHGTGNEANTGSLEASAPVVLNMTQNYPLNYACIGNVGEGAAFDPGNTYCQNGIQATAPVRNSAFPLNVTSIPTKAVWSYAQQWSFGIQRQLPKDLVTTVAYVGSKGTHLTVERQLNQIPPVFPANNPFGLNEPLTETDCTFVPSGSGGNPGNLNNQPFLLKNGTLVSSQDPAYDYLRAACASNNTPDLNALPRPYPGLGKIFALQNGADSIYHGFQATVRRARGPLNLGVSYTYSHSFDDSSDRSDPVLVNSYDLRANRASSNFDERHLLNVSYVYQLPSLARLLKMLTPTLEDVSYGAGTGAPATATPPPPPKPSRLGHLLLENWELSGITIYQSGTPFSVINSAGNTGISLTDNAGVSSGLGIAASFPDVATGLRSPGNNSQSFGPLLGNPSQFVAPRGLTFGNAGRNFLNNPSRLNFDVALLKHFKVTESAILEFRAEAFNVFNHTQFRIYDPDNAGSTGNNIISCYAGPVYSAGYQSPGGADCVTGAAFLHPINAHRPRTLQLGIKLKF